MEIAGYMAHCPATYGKFQVPVRDLISKSRWDLEEHLRFPSGLHTHMHICTYIYMNNAPPVTSWIWRLTENKWDQVPSPGLCGVEESVYWSSVHHMGSNVWRRGTWRMAAPSSQHLPTSNGAEGPVWQPSPALNCCTNKDIVLWRGWCGFPSFNPRPQFIFCCSDPPRLFLLWGYLACVRTMFSGNQDMLNEADSPTTPRWCLSVPDKENPPQALPVILCAPQSHIDWTLQKTLCLWEVLKGDVR